MRRDPAPCPRKTPISTTTGHAGQKSHHPTDHARENPYSERVPIPGGPLQRNLQNVLRNARDLVRIPLREQDDELRIRGRCSKTSVDGLQHCLSLLSQQRNGRGSCSGSLPPALSGSKRPDIRFACCFVAEKDNGTSLY